MMRTNYIVSGMIFGGSSIYNVSFCPSALLPAFISALLLNRASTNICEIKQ